VKPAPAPTPTGYNVDGTYYRPVQTVEGEWVHVPVCNGCGSNHIYDRRDPIPCLKSFAQRLAKLEQAES
jgi:hypothetical protein